MAKTLTAASAKAHFSDALRDAESGVRIVITRHGKPVAVLVHPSLAEQLERLHAASRHGGLGSLAGRYDDGDVSLRHERHLRSAARTASPTLCVNRRSGDMVTCRDGPGCPAAAFALVLHHVLGRYPPRPSPWLPSTPDSGPLCDTAQRAMLA